MEIIPLERLQNLKILRDLREIYYENTGMVVSFHYPGMNPQSTRHLDFFPYKQKNEYCKLIQSTEKGLRKCLESDQKGLENAKKRGNYAIYTCHAGLVDIAIPLMYKGIEIGAIYTGQVLIKEPSTVTFDKIFKKLDYIDVDYETLKNAYFKVKVVNEKKLIFYVKLLSLMANYIISVENDLYLQREINLKNKELRRKEIEKSKLEKELKDLSISILEYEKIQKAKSNISENVNEDYIISKAQLFIKSNYDKPLRLEDVAKAVYLSPNYFSSMFKKITGYTFSSYLTRKRIEAAKELLIKTNLPIKEIVEKVGFEDYNYFNRTFKKIEKVPPAQFRKQNKKDY